MISEQQLTMAFARALEITGLSTSLLAQNGTSILAPGTYPSVEIGAFIGSGTVVFTTCTGLGPGNIPVDFRLTPSFFTTIPDGVLITIPKGYRITSIVTTGGTLIAYTVAS